MIRRGPLAAAAVAVALCGAAMAETIATKDGIAVKDAAMPVPARGMTMEEVTGKFGAPSAKVPAVGNPPISRWEYPGFIVYFEHDHVIHTVTTAAPPPAAAP